MKAHPQIIRAWLPPRPRTAPGPSLWQRGSRVVAVLILVALAFAAGVKYERGRAVPHVFTPTKKP